MSSPVTDSAAVLSLHHAAGIWKSPMNLPDSGAVSTRVNPVAPNPVSVVRSSRATCAPFSQVFGVGVVHNPSSNVTSSSLPS